MNHEMELRLAVDMGSGATKTALLQVNKATNTIYQVLKEASFEYKYQECISKSPNSKTLTEQCQDEGLNLMRSIKDYYHVDSLQVKMGGFATAWARNADNASEYLQKLEGEGFHIVKISQMKEGELGYTATMQCLAAQHKPITHALVWDIGGGSFQLDITYDSKFHVYEGAYGAGNFAAEARKAINKSSGLLNHTEAEAVKTWAFDKICPSLKTDTLISGNTTEDFSVYGIGKLMTSGLHSLVNTDYITHSDVLGLIDYFSEHSQSELHSAFPRLKTEFIEESQTNLIMVNAIMESACINQINFLEGAHSTYAIATENCAMPTEGCDIWNDQYYGNYE